MICFIIYLFIYIFNGNYQLPNVTKFLVSVLVRRWSYLFQRSVQRTGRLQSKDGGTGKRRNLGKPLQDNNSLF